MSRLLTDSPDKTFWLWMALAAGLGISDRLPHGSWQWWLAVGVPLLVGLFRLAAFVGLLLATLVMAARR
jgi:hypothetical protein